jgi:adenylate kinase family enzyme
MERVAIIGNSGGGKSQLARPLAAKLGLPYLDLDSILWCPVWRSAPAASYQSEHARLIAEERWLLDGLGKPDSVPARLARATDIVLIDLPLWMHFWLAANDKFSGRQEIPSSAGGHRRGAAVTRALQDGLGK